METQPDVVNTRKQHDLTHDSKIEGDNAVDAIGVDPSSEVSKKRQSLSDIFTIVRAPAQTPVHWSSRYEFDN